MKLALLMALAALAAAQPVDLQGQWKWSTEDRTDFARPDFDDSAWQTFTLPVRSNLPAGVNWLRRTVNVPVPDRELSLVTGGVTACYDAYVNGQMVRQSPCGAGRAMPFYLPRITPIPKGVIHQDGRAFVALRIDRPEMRQGIVLPGDKGPYVIVAARYAGPIADFARHDMERSLTLSTLIGLAEYGIAVLLLVFWLGNRGRMEYFFFGLFLAGVGSNAIGGILMMHFDRYPNLYIRPGAIGLAALMFGCSMVFRRQIFPGYLALAGTTIGFVDGIVRPGLLLTPLFMAVPFAWAVQAIGRRNWEGRLFGTAIVAYSIAVHGGRIQSWFPNWPIPFSWSMGPYVASTPGTVSFGVAVVVLIILVRLAGADARERARLASEMEAARAVQQLLVAKSSGDGVEYVYAPAQEVGGDFYHRWDDGKGGFLLVVGDVSGKGLKAAMLVSMAVGALRALPRTTSPAAVLAGLNAALCGQTGSGFVTCCCAWFAAEGRVAMANAGHPNPYADGRELELAAGLPLGVVEQAEYSETRVEGARFTFVSDGVVEACNGKGELFGFERTREVSGNPAAAIAEAARAWGQNDDITVVTVRRAA